MHNTYNIRTYDTTKTFCYTCSQVNISTQLSNICVISVFEHSMLNKYRVYFIFDDCREYFMLKMDITSLFHDSYNTIHYCFRICYHINVGLSGEILLYYRSQYYISDFSCWKLLLATTMFTRDGK